MIELKSPDEINKLRRSGQLVAHILQELRAAVKPGVTTGELDQMAEKLILKNNATPAFKGYRGFPACLCIAVNDEVVHGIPGKKVLKEGDIVGLDCGVLLDGFYGDSGRTFPVGEISEANKNLLKAAENALNKGLEQVKDGNRVHDISAAVQASAEKAGYGIVKDFVGHGIGRHLHEEPQIPNFGKAGTGLRLSTGMVLAVEPMLNIGGPDIKMLDDGWTAVTADGSFSVHIEDMIAITENGPEILTRVK
jgi:methionyl aminopeptidase